MSLTEIIGRGKANKVEGKATETKQTKRTN